MRLFFLSCPRFSEKVLKQRAALFSADAGKDRRMMAVAFGKEIDNAAAGTGILLPDAEDDPGNAGVDDGAGTHGTGLQCDIEAAAVQTPVPACRTGFADGLQLGMGRGVMRFFPPVPAAADDVPVPVRDDAADGNLALFGGFRRETERPEAVEAGTVRLAGTESASIIELADRLLDDREAYDAMAKAVNPYGDGQACRRIADAIEYHFHLTETAPDPFTPERGT